MRVGVVILPEHRRGEAARRWRTVEELGFDHAWTYDHLAWRSLADGPWFSTVGTLAAACTVTTRVGLGTWVLSPNFRHPVPWARDVMTLDEMSAGRFLCGIGAGGAGFDASVLGQDPLTPGQLIDRLGEFVELLDLLLTGDHVNYQGSYPPQSTLAPHPAASSGRGLRSWSPAVAHAGSGSRCGPATSGVRRRTVVAGRE
ncbi:MAG: LLM class flavin-dependent oxidoreductase [Sporichthyaceae bacterium]|nr:LLM class flavin-dependent oxidoreductase [Sporichthyaceae bacterium]